MLDPGLKWATLVDPLDPLSNPDVTCISDMTHALVAHMLKYNTNDMENSDMNNTQISAFL